ncbi:hypothetical protein [Magnetovibrio sp.]|uniref:hypothetical protein n=1 Tax=Magnetovibrio sp. TaxID=2024836 RepID=UPI002F9248AF
MPETMPQQTPPVSPAPTPPPSPTVPPSAAPAPAPEQASHNEPQTESDTKNGQRLRDAIADAHALLDFAARHGMHLEHAITGPIIASHDKMARGIPLDAPEQEQLWNAFSAIMDRVKPVTVESIRFSKPGNGVDAQLSWLSRMFASSTPAERVLRRYLTVAVISLLSLLSLQVEWAIGMAIYNDAYEVHRGYLSSTDQLLDARQISSSLKDTKTVAAADALAKLEKIERRHAQSGSWDDVSYVRLWWWNRQVAALFPPYDLKINAKGPRTEAGDVKLDTVGERRIEFTRAQLTLEVIANYVLVALFALLGSMTQALRSLSADIDTVSLTANRLYAIRTQIILGVISGVCMGWLVIISAGDGSLTPPAEQFTPLTSISFLGAFTPWALAFISGYSVEIFFTALERIINVITRRIETPTDDQPSLSPSPDATANQHDDEAGSKQPPSAKPIQQPQQVASASPASPATPTVPTT